MKNPLVYAILISCLSLFLFGALIYYSLTSHPNQPITSEAVAGKKIWESYGCIECHAIFGNGGYSAPELTKTYQERGRAWLEDFFQNPPFMRPSTKKTHLSLPENEAAKIIEYLRYLSQTKLLNWPPKPLALPAKE